MLRVLILTVFFSTSVIAQVKSLNVSDAYVRGLPPGVSNTSAYMTLHNSGNHGLELISVTSNIAESVTIHNTQMEDGLMKMHHMMSLIIPAGSDVVLASGGIHLMLMGLSRSIKEGEQVEMNLEFADGSRKKLSLPVISILNE